MLLLCAFSSWISLGLTDLAADNVAKSLLHYNKLTMAGRKEDSDLALQQELEQVVPVAAILGGLTLGCICIVSGIIGVIGGGQGMLLATNIIYSYYETGLKERAMVEARSELDRHRY
jgi:protein transport protein SEC61 subunit alpha